MSEKHPNFGDRETQYLQSNGLRMAYETFGEPKNPAILLVAGLYNQLVGNCTVRL